MARCLLDVSWGRCFRHAHPGGDPRADQGQAGEIISLCWLENVLVFFAKVVDPVTQTQISVRKHNKRDYCVPVFAGAAKNNQTFKDVFST